MSQGTVYHKNTGREVVLKAITAELGLDVKFSEPDAKFAEEFPLKKVPTYVNGNFVLHEVIAIARYLSSLSEDSKLFGTSAKQEAEILQWLSFANDDLLHAIISAYLSIKGITPYNKKSVDASLADADKFAAVFEAHLRNNTYLVGERPTAADYHAVSVCTYGYKNFWTKAWAKAHPYTTRWYRTITARKPVSEFLKGEICAEPLKYTPPKKEKKEVSKKETPKAEKKAAPKKEEEEHDAPVEKKAVHPLSLLPKPKMAIDEWKRCYSNEDTREKALPWFWEHYNPEDYSLYKVAYKYNDELTLTFMSNNLVGGFFNRLLASTKYLFGCMVVYGENNNNGIVGVFLVRGQDYVPAFDVAPDWESYDFTKLDPTKPEVKEYIEDLWSWDKPLEINGEKREVADGKVFK